MNGLLDSDWQRDGLSLRCRLRSEVTVAEDGAAGLTAAHAWGTSRIGGVGPTVAHTLRTLADNWVDGSALQSMCMEGEEMPQHVWALEKLGFLVVVQLVVEGRPFLTIEPSSYSARLPADFSGGAGRGLSRFSFLRRDGDCLALESAASAHRAVLQDERALLLTDRLTRDAPAAGVSGAERLAIGLLDAVGMLEGSERLVAGLGDELLRTAEFHDLLLHRRSRFGKHDGPFGASFPFLEIQPPPPALVPPLAGNAISLPRPSAQSVRERDPTLTQALERRVSERHHSSQPLTMAQLGEFLFRCARTRGRYGPAPEAGMPYEAADRPYPSGGGVHDLELYLVATRVRGLEPGAYHYAGDRHALELLPARPEATALLLRAAMQASATSEPPHLLIKIASRFERVAWKYRAISYATTLKNVGVLYQTMYLVATAMGLAACALGSGDDAAGDEALGLADRSELGVGEFMLGSPASAGPTLPYRHADPTWTPLTGPDWGCD